MEAEQIKTIMIDGIEHTVADLTTEQQRLIRVYESCFAEKQAAENTIIKMNASMTGLSQALIESIKATQAANDATPTEQPAQ